MAGRDRVHGGYFSDPRIAATFIDQVRQAMDASRAQVVVDLGGGTGFLLRELIRTCPPTTAKFVNMDLSEKQLSQINHPQITPLLGSIDTLERIKIDDPEKRFLFFMRSVLHYCGRQGLLPALQRIRSQTRPGEYFVHQTVVFESEPACQCLNTLYEEMGTGKWYPMHEEFEGLLKTAGWSIHSCVPAAVLPLNSDELEQRYGLKDTAHIQAILLDRFGLIENAFVLTPSGFCAYLPYRIYSCIAV